MNTNRNTLNLDCGFDKVFNALRKLSVKGFKVARVDEANRLVVINTSMSLLSWGEQLEVVVTPIGDKSSVSIRSSARHPLNITADTNAPISQLVDLIQKICSA